MDFPILDICDDELGETWLQKHFHPCGLRCPGCGAGVKQARSFGHTRRSHVTVLRCRHCQKRYTVYAGTVFAHKHWRPAQVALRWALEQPAISSVIIGARTSEQLKDNLEVAA